MYRVYIYTIGATEPHTKSPDFKDYAEAIAWMWTSYSTWDKGNEQWELRRVQ